MKRILAEQRTPAPDFLNMVLELGAARCLRKPFTPRTLLGVIDTCLLEIRSTGVEERWPVNPKASGARHR